MTYTLRIFDFHLNNKSTGDNTSYLTLALNHPELLNSITSKRKIPENVQRQVIFNSFKKKMTKDLDSEVLKHLVSKKIVKRSKRYIGKKIVAQDLHIDYPNKLLYGVLHGGRIAENAMLESPVDEDYKYASLKGDRIYDDFFFMIHISFGTNLARLFIINGGNNANVDSVLKKYFKDVLFKSPNFNKTKMSDFIPPEYRDEVLGRVTINNVLVSKADTVITQSDGVEYEVEIRLKPKSTNALARLTDLTVSLLRKSKVLIDKSSADDENSDLRFSVKDPETGKTKIIAYGGEDSFIPRIVLDENQIYGQDNQVDIQGLKEICLRYVEIVNIELG